MEMPTVCAECGELFDLLDGRGGLTHRTSDFTICKSCYEKQYQEKQRVDTIRELLEKKENASSEIERLMNEITEMAEWRDEHRQNLNEYSMELKKLDYKGEKDDYHEELERYY